MAVEIVTLMVLLSEQGTDFETLWNTVGGVNDAPSKHTTPLDDIILSGNFRSAVVDTWSTEAFEEVHLVGMNRLGDTFWSTEFDATGTGFDMSSWLIAGKFLGSSAVPTDTPVITKSDDNYALRISPASDTDKAWFAITTNTLYTYPPLPLFYAAKKPAVPFDFPEVNSGSYGCVDVDGSQFSDYTEKYTTSTGNTVEMCVDQCTGFNAAILLSAVKCYCGNFVSLTPTFDFFCVLDCPGDSSQKCGGHFPNLASVYHIQGTSSIPGEMVTAVYYNQSHTLTGTSLELDWMTIVASPPGDSLLATSLLVGSSTTTTFSISYSDLECTLATPQTTYVYHVGPQQTFPTGAELSVGIISFRCITFTFDVVLPSAMITITGPIDSQIHIQVPVVAVQATRTVPDTTTTTTTSTTTTTPTTTSTTTTTTPTTTSTTTTTTPTTTSTTTTTPTTTSTTTTTTPTTTSTTTPTTTSTTTTTPTTTSTTTTTPTTTTPTTTSTTTTTPTTTSTSTSTTSTSTSTTTTPTSTSTTPSSTSTTSTSTSSTTSSTTSTSSTSSTSTQTTPTSTSVSTSASTPSTTTALSTTTVQTSTTEPKRCFCPCTNSSQLLNMTADELRAKVLSIQKKLALNVSSLSATIRKLTSAEDNRASSVSIGFVGVSILVSVIGTLILIDATTIFRHLLQLKDNVKSWLCQQDVAPS